MALKLTFEQSEQITVDLIQTLKDKEVKGNTPRSEYARCTYGIFFFSTLIFFVMLIPQVYPKTFGFLTNLVYIFITILVLASIVSFFLFLVGIIINSWISELIIEKIWLHSTFILLLVYAPMMAFYIVVNILDSKLTFITFKILSVCVLFCALLQSFIEYRKYRKLKKGFVVNKEKNGWLVAATEKTIDVETAGKDKEEIEDFKDIIGSLAFSHDDTLSKYHNFILARVVPILVVVGVIVDLPTFFSFKVSMVRNVEGLFFGFIMCPAVMYFVTYIFFAYGPLQEIIPIYYLKKYQKEYSEKYKINLGRRKNGK